MKRPPALDPHYGWLVGWKAITAYMGVHVQTIRNDYIPHGLPIRRSPGGTPIAMPHELDRWLTLFDDNVRRIKGKKPVALPNSQK